MLHKKSSFSLRISPVNVTKSAGKSDLVTFTGEILNGKLHFLCSDILTINCHLRYFPSLVIIEEYFHIFGNENNTNWSLIISPIPIEKFRINVWVSLAKLPCIACWVHCLIFNGTSRPDLFCEKAVLEVSQNPHENTCARPGLQLY